MLETCYGHRPVHKVMHCENCVSLVMVAGVLEKTEALSYTAFVLNLLLSEVVLLVCKVTVHTQLSE